MQIVIEIDEEIYNHMKERFMYGYADTELGKVGLAVRNGIPLPKGHGDLIDRSKILPYMESRFDMQDLYLPTHFKDFVIDELQIVVPADEEGDSDAETDKG